MTIFEAENLHWNNGNPEGAVVAPKGSMCSDYANNVLYSKQTGSGNTGWEIYPGGEMMIGQGINYAMNGSALTDLAEIAIKIPKYVVTRFICHSETAAFGLLQMGLYNAAAGVGQVVAPALISALLGSSGLSPVQTASSLIPRRVVSSLSVGTFNISIMGIPIK